MVAIDYMAHQEQYEPSRLLDLSERAVEAGFDMVWTSDHFHPWFHTDAEAGFAWSWLGAAVERLDAPVGTCVTPAAGHYHPAVIAQSFATLQSMSDEDVVLGVSTGEAMNETPLGHDWPDYGVRRDRLKESLDVITRLWADDGFASYDGDHYQLDDAKLYTMPDSPPDLHVAANGPSTASLAGEYADGFITVVKDEEFSERLAPAVRRHAADADRDPDAVETTLLVIASYDPNYEAAFESTRPWWGTTQDVFDRALADPREIEAEGANATPEDVETKFLVADSPADIAETLEGYAELGFDRIALGNTSPDPKRFLDVMGNDVIPTL